MMQQVALLLQLPWVGRVLLAVWQQCEWQVLAQGGHKLERAIDNEQITRAMNQSLHSKLMMQLTAIQPGNE